MYETHDRGKSKPRPKKCSKITYFSERGAAKHARQICKKSKRPLELRPYLCPQCNRWHLTSKRDLWAEIDRLPKAEGVPGKP